MRIAYFGRLVKVGNSFVITVPKDVRYLLELNKDDYVRIELKKVILDESNLHADDAARTDPETRDKGIHQEE